VENYMIEKLLELMDFPADGDGVFCPGSSQANMYGIVLARQRHCPDIRSNGLYQYSKLIAYTSEDVSDGIRNNN
jgi:glutamate/tyrosine decarboxylase-like PLP-dependent enzyme